MQYATCCVPVSTLRKQPFHNVEIVTQQLFGECCTVLETLNGWMKIRCRYDNYEGWCQASHLVEIDSEQFSSSNKKLATEWVNKVLFNKEKMCVPLGSCLATFKKNKVKWQNNAVSYEGKTFSPARKKITKQNIKSISYKFINTPYLWGGKSVFGIDCSGFTQMVYKFLNIYLPRDSSQQAMGGDTIDFLHAAKCGDLAFFDNEEGRIIHVGLLLNNHTIIHSSGKVRIDNIEPQGIINSETQQRTHKLRIIKRYF